MEGSVSGGSLQQIAVLTHSSSDLPFGRGILSLPQRGKTALEMYAYSGHQEPIETFEGHTGVCHLPSFFRD